jgi:peptidoglycan-associated lipoprotein
MSKRPFWMLSLPALALLLTGCPKTSTVTPEEEAAQAAPGEEAAPAEDAAAAGAPALEIGTEYAPVPDLPAVRFGYMTADLTAESRESLKRNASVLKSILKAAPSVQVRVEGHCDDRGTLEYNLSLGQRRANAVKDYYQSLGIAKAAIKTVSYGEERPVCGVASEACWAENRRGETTLRSSEPVRIPAGDLAQN